MALKIGTLAPDFSLHGTSDLLLHLHRDLKGKSFILFFYPKDFTRVCTAEACDFRDQFESFRNLEVPVFGISRDDLDSHSRFKEQYKLPFELLSDPNGVVCKAYDALVPLIRLPKRVTYLIDPQLKIAAVYADMFESRGHIEAMLHKLQS